MKKNLKTLAVCLAFLVSVTASSQYFEATLKASGTNIQIFFRPKPTGGNISTDFSLVEFFIRVPTSVTGLTFGSVTTNTVDFPGLAIAAASPNFVNAQGTEVGYNNYWFIGAVPSVPPPTVGNYLDGTEYLVATIPVLISGVPTNPSTITGFEVVSNSDFTPHYLTITSTTGGVDLTARLGAFPSSAQVFYAPPGGNIGSCGAACSAGPGSTNLFARLGGTLPVVFDKYIIECNDKGALLIWNTVSEHNSSHFEVQRSTNGIDWVTIDNVAAAGNSDIVRNYQYLDISAPGSSFYRLKQVDLDGRFIYTAIRRTNCKSKQTEAVIYPIPAKDNITLVLKSDNTVVAEFQITDVTGKLLQKVEKTVSQGNNNLVFNVGNLPSGQYLLKSNRPELDINKKFVVAR